LVALVIALTLKEPEKDEAVHADPMPFRQAIAFLLSQKSFVLTLCGALFFNFTYAANGWLPSFLARVHQMPLRDVGFALAGAHGVFGTIGAIGGGWLATRLGRGDDRVRLWWAAGACLAGMIPYAAFLLLEGGIAGSGYPVALYGLCFVYLFLASVFGPLMASYQAGARSDMRSLAAAVYWIVGGLGLSLGPLIIGALNDLLAASLGLKAIRVSLFSAVFSLPVASIFFLLASRHIRADAKRAEASTGSAA
jgi:MFS family permease